ncbi:V-type proton ATPase subunit C-like isoform X4 [Quercus lobata]|uniref:V-type proton ATPase subunit C-like isoform X4 n=1 Tax=Quercus lobata TaxID=97700 RepID=UPI00124847AA|nr:V-type proton ATPase subunit C-like isoform X4 [Quercus lobata]
MATRYWVVSLPVQNSASSLWNRLQDQISKHSLDTPLYRILGAATARNQRTLVRVAEYNNMRSQLNAINRKQSGSLAVRDLSNLVKPEDIITSEHLVTLLAIVPKYSQKDWLASYETLTSYVVPRSSKKLYEENEYALYTVTLFGCVADNFRTAARERGFQIRDFEYSPEAQESRKQELEKLMQDPGSLRSSLLQWCYNSYGEVFSSWMQFCPVRVFAESILRYGLPPSFLACVLAPSVKSEKKVRSILEGLCDSVNSTYWKTEDEAGGGVAGLAGDADAHPYVSFTINLI